MPINSDELLDIVDEKDRIIGFDTKENKYKNELISRNVAVFIADKDNKLLVAKRSELKKNFPGRYDPAAVGNVKHEESYEAAAQRELLEECGIKCELRFLKKIFSEHREGKKRLRYITGVFLGKYDGKAKLCAELTEIRRLSLFEVESKILFNKDLFTPGFIQEFKVVKEALEANGKDSKPGQKGV